MYIPILKLTLRYGVHYIRQEDLRCLESNQFSGASDVRDLFDNA